MSTVKLTWNKTSQPTCNEALGPSTVVSKTLEPDFRTLNPNPQFSNRKLQLKPQTPIQKPETRNPNLQTPNPKPQSLTPKPQTRNLKRSSRDHGIHALQVSEARWSCVCSHAGFPSSPDPKPIDQKPQPPQTQNPGSETRNKRTGPRLDSWASRGLRTQS